MHQHIDLYTGIGGFTLAAESTGKFKTQITSEIDPYCVKFIDHNLGLENAGSVTDFAVSQMNHSALSMVDQDLVPVEETGMTSICLEDYFEGVLEFPYLATGGFPCQDVSSANLQGEGIKGSNSSLVEEQLRTIRSLEPPFCIFENSSRLVSKGLNYILGELHDMGYIVEWETISAATFGYPHYRHRCYIVAYLPDTVAGRTGKRIFERVREIAPDKPQWSMPLNTPENASQVLASAVVEDPRSIKLRTKRINALGNSIVLDIAKAIIQAILDIEENGISLNNPKLYSEHICSVLEGECMAPSNDLFAKPEPVLSLPASGFMKHGEVYCPASPCRKLNPTTSQYPFMFSTLIRKDGNNNFSCKSRLNRPGKLGGLIGDIMRLGATQGGLNPEFGEQMMGYKKGYTELAA